MTIDEPALMSLTEIAAAIKSKAISSVEATRSCLERIARYQPYLNAFVAVDAEAVLADASAADDALARSECYGPLHGVPFAHKDMFYDAGHVVTCGSRIRQNWVAPITATVLQRLRKAGALRLGSLQMAEFAYGSIGHNPHYGDVRNPWNADHVTGGSSSGSAAAVAARLTFASLGSDTGGSIRLPAHFCGVTGLKTTAGLVSRAGAMPLSHSLDTIGPIAQTVADCALLAGLIAGSDPLDPTTSARVLPLHDQSTNASVKGVSVGIPKRYYVEDLDADVARALDDTIAVFRHEGIAIVEVDLPDQHRVVAACQLLLAAEAASIHKRWMVERPQDYGRRLFSLLHNGFSIPSVSYLDALRWRGPALEAHLAAVSGVDAILIPVAPAAAPTLVDTDPTKSTTAIAQTQRLMRFTRPANYLGLPSLSVPAGASCKNLPIGMQIVGRPFGEPLLFSIGAAFQRATDWHKRLIPALARTEADNTASAVKTDDVCDHAGLKR